MFRRHSKIRAVAQSAPEACRCLEWFHELGVHAPGWDVPLIEVPMAKVPVAARDAAGSPAVMVLARSA